MKSFRKSFRLVWVLLLVPILFIFIRCSFKSDLNKIQSSLENTKLIFGTPKFKNVIHFEFTDAKTNLPVTGAIKLKVSGPGVSKVYSNIGEQKPEYTATDGILDLALDPHIDSTYLEQNPVRFDITCQISGYLDETRQIEVSHGRIKYVPVSLINLNDGNTAGVKVSVQSLTPSYDAGNKTINPITQQIDGTNTTIEILQGTVLKDASGNPLTGTVNSQVVFFSAADKDTQNLIQDDLTGEVQLKDGSTTQTRLISAGMFSIRLTVGDKTVKIIDGNGLKISTRIPADLFNPVKSRAILVGDTIPLWSRADGSSKWIFENNTVVKSDASGFYVEFIVNHLSEYNLDWHLTYCDHYPKICWSLSDFDGAYIKVNVDFDKKYQDGEPIWSDQIPEWIYPGNCTQINYAPQNIAGKITYSDLYPLLGRSLVFYPASISFTDICSLPDQTVYVTAVYDPDVLTVKFKLSAKSSDPNDNTIIHPNIYLYYTVDNTNGWGCINMVNGVGTLMLVPGHDYRFSGDVGRKVYGILRIDNVGNNQVQVKLTPTISNVQISSSDMKSFEPITIPMDKTINVDFTAILSPDVFNTIKQ